MNDQPWLEKKAWQKNEIPSNAKSSFISLWIFSVVWLGIVGVVIAVGATEILAQAKEKPITYVFLLFPLVGLYLLWLAVRATLQWFSIGRTPLVMDPFPGSIGGHVGGMVTTNLKYDVAMTATVQIKCLHSRMTGSGKNRRRSESVVWENSGESLQGQSPNGAHFQFRFDTPESLPSSDASKKSSSYHLWRLTIEIKTAQSKKIRRSFEVPVYPTGAQSEFIRQGTEDHEGTQQAAESSLETIADIQITGRGLEVFFPAFRRSASDIIFALVGAIFTAAGIYIVSLGESKFFHIMTALGALFVLSGCFNFGKSLRVIANQQEIIVSRALYGIPLYTHSIPSTNVVSLELQKVGSSQSGDKTTAHYVLRAKSTEGKEYILAERLNSRPEAELIQNKLQAAIE